MSSVKNWRDEVGRRMTGNRFFTSDHHFGHINILKYQAEERRNGYGQPFSSIGEMDDYLVDQWNALVGEGDMVYCLGDFCYSYEQMSDVLPFLNGKKILIAGNHDPFFSKMIDGDPCASAEARELALRAGFEEIHLHHEIDIAGIGLVRLCHFPYAPPAHIRGGLPAVELRYLENRPPWRKERLLLHGHVHSQWLEHKYPGLVHMINVGVDMWGMRPVSESKIVEKFRCVAPT
jgi:calcineurin-like phosphoesterase family protein